MDGSKENHLLNLKVMRLSKPNIPISNPTLCEKEDLAFDSLMNPNVGISGGGGDSMGGGTEALGMTPMLMLQSGVIYLGEIFSSYISLNNHSPYEVKNVFIKVELQTTSQRISLLDSEQQPVQSFGPGFSSDFVVQREVKESGVNILVCSVNYNTIEGENKKFRKFFRFQVMNPLVLKTRVHNLPNLIFLEACLENATQGSLFIESMQFEPTEHFKFIDISNGGTEENVDEKAEKEAEFKKILQNISGGQTKLSSDLSTVLSLVKVSQDVVFLKQGNSRQYLFKIIPINPMDAETKNAVSLGRLDITWRSYFGEIGRLKTAPIQRKLNNDEIECIITSIPPSVILEKPFTVSLRLTNKSNRFLTPQFILVRNKIDGITINGHLPRIDIIQPLTSINFEIDLFPLKPGMQQIVGLAIKVNDPNPTTPSSTTTNPTSSTGPVPIKPVIMTSATGSTYSNTPPKISTIITSSTSSVHHNSSPSNTNSSQPKNFYELGVLADIFVENDIE
ncbi:DUF974 family protein [Tieghemostelium lacteum]|uniref:DUF974 family protein n=1 Tax=Tieghemostelium lacteum TaxID=361077 RepID=A0A152A0P6_TIELA|nr:DUF974 family protein [Tieghemostelium lacteum]|eukprot:KYQ99789.1 DUF974 family protein [Tieghemostelium lacteum]